MGAQDGFVVYGPGLAPIPRWMAILQEWDGAHDPRGTLRMAGQGIIHAPRIVENDHTYGDEDAVGCSASLASNAFRFLWMRAP